MVWAGAAIDRYQDTQPITYESVRSPADDLRVGAGQLLTICHQLPMFDGERIVQRCGAALFRCSSTRSTGTHSHSEKDRKP